MSTALLKFQPSSQPPKEVPVDPGILVAALDSSPEPIAVTENGKLIYANRSFAQFSDQFEQRKPQPDPVALSDSGWRSTGFTVGLRTFSLTTARRGPPQHS